MSDDVVSAEKAQQVIDAVNAACELGGMGSDEAAVSVVMERLARTVLTLHARLSAQATELAVLRAQLSPLLAVHDALVAAAALPGAGASGVELVAAVWAKASADAREDLARIGRLVGCDSLVGVEINAAVEHVVRHELEAARDAAERAERERDDARAEVETLRAEAALMREKLAAHARHTDAAVDGVRAMLPAALDLARREGAEAMREWAANACERMVVGGCAWSEEQATAARALLDAAGNVRALPLDAPGGES
jgi:hypothetical protein